MSHAVTVLSLSLVQCDYLVTFCVPGVMNRRTSQQEMLLLLNQAPSYGV